MTLVTMMVNGRGVGGGNSSGGGNNNHDHADGD